MMQCKFPHSVPLWGNNDRIYSYRHVARLIFHQFWTIMIIGVVVERGGGGSIQDKWGEEKFCWPLSWWIHRKSFHIKHHFWFKKLSHSSFINICFVMLFYLRFFLFCFSFALSSPWLLFTQQDWRAASLPLDSLRVFKMHLKRTWTYALLLMPLDVLRTQKESDSSSLFMLYTHLHNAHMTTRSALCDKNPI